MMCSAKNDIAKIITSMFAAYGKAGEGQRISVYVKMLEGFPADVLSIACKKAMLERPFVPSISELVESVKSIVGEATGNRTKPWGEAWLEIETAMHKYGFYQSPKWSNDAIGETVKAVGWRNLCCCEMDSLFALRAQTKSIYASVCKRMDEKAINGYVLGGKGDEKFKKLAGRLQALSGKEKGKGNERNSIADSDNGCAISVVGVRNQDGQRD